MGKIIMNGKEYIGSGGGGSLTMLSNATITSLNAPVSLADDITNYDLILVHAYYTGGSGYPLVASQAFAPSQLITHNRQTWLVGGNADRMISINFPTNTTIQMINSNGGNGIQGVYGIKFYGNSNNDRHDYSTVEKVVGSWIDGKPLYEITVQGNISSQTGYINLFTLASGVTIQRIDGYVRRTGDINIPSGSLGFYVYSQGSDVNCYNSEQGNSGQPFTVIVQYTKTTD